MTRKAPLTRIRKMLPAGLCAAVLCLTSVPAAAQSEPSSKSETSSGGYFIEFRVAQIGTYGHSYVVYGPVGGRPSFADLHPMGGYAVMALGHVVPVPANTEWDPEVVKLPIAARYRRTLNAQDYRRL